MHTVQRVSGLGRGVGPRFLCIPDPGPGPISGLGFSGLVGGGGPHGSRVPCRDSCTGDLPSGPISGLLFPNAAKHYSNLE